MMGEKILISLILLFSLLSTVCGMLFILCIVWVFGNGELVGIYSCWGILKIVIFF